VTPRRAPSFAAATLAFAAFTSSVDAVASPESVDLLSGFALTSWTDGDGIPLGTVYAIGQDRDNYLWIGTDAGLLRFDGVRFTPWDQAHDPAMPRAPVTALWVARDDTLWVGFVGSGVVRLRHGRIRAEDQIAGALGSVTDLAEDRTGTMWAVGDGRLFRTHGRAWEKAPLTWNSAEPTTLHLFVTAGGELWVGTAQGGVFRYDDRAGAFVRMAPGFTWGIGQDAGGGIWTTDIVSGFRRLGDSSRPRLPFEGSGYRLLHDRRGNLWVATLGAGLWRVRTDGGAPAVERTALRTGLSSDSVQSLLEDRDGNIWVGTTGGLHRLTERPLTPVENVGFVVDVAREESGSVVAGTTSGLAIFSARRGEWRRARDGSGGPDVRTLFRDPSGVLWIGTNTGVLRFAGGRFARVALSPPPATPTTQVTAAAQGGVWLLYNGWLYRCTGSGTQPETPAALVLPREAGVRRITAAYTDSVGRLWIAFDQSGVGFVDPGGAFRALGSSEGLPPGTQTAVYSFFEDREHVVWIAGAGGVSRFANGRVVTLTADNGLPGARVWSVLEDGEGYLWLSVDRGLLRVDRRELAAAAADRGHRIRYRLYDTSDGLAGAPLGNIRSARGSDGRLWFVRGGGLTEVDPRRLGPDGPRRAPVRIESAVANEQRLAPDPLVRLPAGTKRLQISYTAVALTGSNKLRFRYRLDGFDTAWVDAGTRRQAFYTNLSPGSYRFRVETTEEDGTWSPADATWAFAIRPAFYQTSWFYAAMLAAVGLAVAAAWRARLRRVRRDFSLVLAERARLSREIHDTLLQSLVGVALQFDGIANALDGSAAAARDQLVRIRRQVEAYIREARQSIWDLRSPVLETHDLAAALRAFGKRAVAGTPVRFAVTVVGTPRRSSPKVENQLLRIGQEAITNAVRHAQATRIALEVRFDEQAITLRVVDDGRGFEYEYPGREADAHYGLTTMKERAEELGGRFTIRTGAGRGTAVETVVPTPARA